MHIKKEKNKVISKEKIIILLLTTTHHKIAEATKRTPLSFQKQKLEVSLVVQGACRSHSFKTTRRTEKSCCLEVKYEVQKYDFTLFIFPCILDNQTFIFSFHFPAHFQQPQMNQKIATIRAKPDLLLWVSRRLESLFTI